MEWDVNFEGIANTGVRIDYETVKMVFETEYGMSLYEPSPSILLFHFNYRIIQQMLKKVLLSNDTYILRSANNKDETQCSNPLILQSSQFPDIKLFYVYSLLSLTELSLL